MTENYLLQSLSAMKSHKQSHADHTEPHQHHRRETDNRKTGWFQRT